MTRKIRCSCHNQFAVGYLIHGYCAESDAAPFGVWGPGVVLKPWNTVTDVGLHTVCLQYSIVCLPTTLDNLEDERGGGEDSQVQSWRDVKEDLRLSCAFLAAELA